MLVLARVSIEFSFMWSRTTNVINVVVVLKRDCHGRYPKT